MVSLYKHWEMSQYNTGVNHRKCTHNVYICNDYVYICNDLHLCCIETSPNNVYICNDLHLYCIETSPNVCTG